MSDAPRISMALGPREPDPVIRVVCRDPRHPAPRTMAELRREDRWDGSGGHYWVRLARMTNRERAVWEVAEPGDGTTMPRDYRDAPEDDGFTWLRNGKRVTRAEGYTIGQAAHHNALKQRTGTPAPGTLDGVTRVFELPRCRCGANGIRRVAAEVVERALDALHERERSEVDLATFRGMVATHRAT